MAMLSVEEALDRVLALAEPLPTEEASIDEAIGRGCAEAVVARCSLPPWDNSAVDGYAVRAADVSAGARLAIVERSYAGRQPTRRVGPGECARIMTGAIMPEGADAVVMQEHTRLLAEDQVEIGAPVPKGAHLRRRGEDVAEGARLFAPGTPLGLAEAGLLWAQGFSSVAVPRRPRVAIVTSGDELRAVGEPDPAGGPPRIIDSNSPVLAAAVRRSGGVPTLLGIAPDRLEAVTEAFAGGLSHDVLLAIAGASVGELDFTREAFARLGVSMDFWKVAMKPGKPLAVGRRGGTLVFGLPGNPVSAMVTFELFVRPALRALQRLPPRVVPVVGRAAVAITQPAGLRYFLRARVEARGDALWAVPVTSQSSGALSSAVGATHLISLPPDGPPVEIGHEIALIPLTWPA